MSDQNESLSSFMNRPVVLDTAGPIVYLGTLKEIRSDGFWLQGADLRDRNEGHLTKEGYVCEARAHGIRPNRRRIFVYRHVVISVSALEDVVTE